MGTQSQQSHPVPVFVTDMLSLHWYGDSHSLTSRFLFSLSFVLSSCFPIALFPSPLNCPFAFSSPLSEQGPRRAAWQETVLLQPLLLSIHLSLAHSLPACLSFPFIALLHHIPCISISWLHSFSVLHTLLCSIPLLPCSCAHLHTNFTTVLVV